VSAPGESRERRGRLRGQSLVEFSLILPLFLLILFGMMEFGFIFTHELTLEYATREGARVGAALGNGSGGSGLTCASGTNAACVDPLIIAAVERVLSSPGSQVVISRVSQIVIYKANSAGADTGTDNVWKYHQGTPQTVDGQLLDFGPTSVGWNASARSSAAPSPDAIGVSLVYTYDYVTPLGSILRFFGGNGGASLTLTDRTVMVLNPSAS
jgi:hypothetical protein